MVTKTAKNLTRFTSLLLALGLLLGLTVVGCSDEDRDTNQQPAVDALINYAFSWAGDEEAKIAADAVTAEAKTYDADGEAVECEIDVDQISQMDLEDSYRQAYIATKSNATELHMIFKDADGNVVADRVSALDFTQSLALVINDDDAKDAEYTMVVDYSGVTEAIMAIDDVEEVMIDETTCELGENYTAVAEKGALLPGEHAVSFNVGAEEWVPATATFDAADAVDYVITVALTDDNFTAEPIPGAPEVHFYPAEATAEAIAAGEVEAIETIDVDVEATADFAVFAVVGNPTEAASYTELARDAETVTVSGLEDNAFVTLAEDDWTLTGVAATEDAQTLTLSYQTEDMEEAATAELAITVGGAVVGATTVAIYPADATAETIAAGEVEAMTEAEVAVGETTDFTVFACTGNSTEAESYTAVARDAAEVTVTLEDNPYVVLDDEALTLKGDQVTEEAQTMTISYQTEDMEEAATAELAITVNGATEETTIAIYPADTIADDIAAGDVVAISSIVVDLGVEANFTVFACTGDTADPNSYTEIERADDNVTASGLEDNAYVTLADDAWTLSGLTETEEDQALTISYETGDMDEAATAELAITVTSAE